MTLTVIEGLIDKRDNLEIVRDQIALILATESTAQQAKAVTAGKDSTQWKLRVFTEAGNPWENVPQDESGADRSPIVNVWFDSSTVSLRASNTVQSQKYEATFNVDCYGFGIARDDPDNVAGHIPGDRDAAFEAQRAARLVRNIIAAAVNTYLQLRGVVWFRMVRNITTFQPAIDGRTVEQVVACRLAVEVHYSESSEQIAGESAELVSVEIKRAVDGSVMVAADYDYTP